MYESRVWMMFFEDLSPYSYSPSTVPMVNVGWLGRGYTFEEGVPDTDLVAALKRLAINPPNLMRGLHDCEFCDVESPIVVEYPDVTIYLGSGEIHVRSKSGVVYAAPTLIAHYVEAHSYLPPASFVDAVRVAIDQV